MNGYSDFYNVVETTENLLRQDLYGPVDENEVIDEEPLNTYVCGILWPKKATTTSKNEVDTSEEDEYLKREIEASDELEDTTLPQNDTIGASNVYKPSAMALSVMVSKNTKRVRAHFSFAKYSHAEERIQIPKKDIDGNEQINERAVHKYTRNPYSLKVEFNVPNKIGRAVGALSELELDFGIDIELYVRKIFENGDKLVTVSVVNKRTAVQKNIEQNIAALFQCKLSINIEDNEFLPIYVGEYSDTDEDVLISNMQYSDVENYAYGHGCSAYYNEVNGKVTEISSDFMPSEEVLQMMPSSLKNNDFLQMVYLVNADRQLVISKLSAFALEYEEWAKIQKTLNKTINEHSKAVALSIKRIGACIARLKKGISVLENDEMAYLAFRLMNQAMCLQRVKTKKCDESAVRWYPFQFAYILQIIPDITLEQSEYRDFVDLLWFPTGGGKTEAYLGVSAFVIFYRRLLGGNESGGVTVLMRYTLRLLTIQQFERATALICSCEYLRVKHNILGGEINIGLWIGSGMTPNHLDDAAEVIKKLRDNGDERIYEGNPCQITTCPWCGSIIDIGCYSISDTMTIRCKNNPKCHFHKSLPIYVVDDDIYKKCPTLVLSTVDKFARIVWEEKSKAIFGKGIFAPPELIIQDELHLISGPLGSISGVYEIAVQKLCENSGRKPKIIASTATVRNARTQIKNLYNKEMFQFPPNGISFRDSFFAKQASKDLRPARRYIGLCESGGSMADLLIRVYANLIFTKNLLIKQGLPANVIDQYYTTIGYFNAIKDLGASSSIINDRVGTMIRFLVAHKFAKIAAEWGLTGKDIYDYERHDELTSRKTAKEIKETLEQLGAKYDSGQCYSYVLASNMLSVGIDIDRLGVMTVYNQPKSNAEYIQATSRVGRSNPGIVLTLYNAMRSRDKSHYEQFPFYHKTFYKYIEATSVTPFSVRAMEKALHAVFVALIRHTIPTLSSNTDAVNFRTTVNGVKEIREFIIGVVKTIAPEAVDHATVCLDYFANEWEIYAKNNRETFKYSKFDGGIALLNPAEKLNDLGLPPTLNALRNVDSNSNVYIVRRD